MKFKIILEKSYEHFEADRLDYTSDYILGFNGDEVTTIISKQSIVAVIEE